MRLCGTQAGTMIFQTSMVVLSLRCCITDVPYPQLSGFPAVNTVEVVSVSKCIGWEDVIYATHAHSTIWLFKNDRTKLDPRS
jgi:hypothetical protein